MSIYSREDAVQAKRKLRSAGLKMAAVLLPGLAMYVLALVKGWYALSLGTAVLMLIWCLFAGDLLLMPHVRYARFLKEMEKGLRRSVDCTPEEIDGEIQMQDGVFVRSLQVRMPDGDSRVYYMNAAKMDFLPEMGGMVRLESYGRHIVKFTRIS